MKAVCIVGSPRSKGSCAYLIDTMIKGMEEAGIEAEKFSLGEMDIQYCRGCKQCYQARKCVIRDDSQKILSAVLNADFTVICAPSYWADVPGQLKVLFDRSTPYGDTNPNRYPTEAGRRKGIAIAVRAGTRPQENEGILDSIQHYFGHLGIETVKRLSLCENDSLEDLKTKHQEFIKEVFFLGRNLKTM